jgi:hypothetical protein
MAALSAAELKRDEDALSDLHAAHGGAELHHLGNAFMTEREGLRRWDHSEREKSVDIAPAHGDWAHDGLVIPFEFG